MPYFGASLTYDANSIINNLIVFMIQATDVYIGSIWALKHTIIVYFLPLRSLAECTSPKIKSIEFVEEWTHPFNTIKGIRFIYT